jgi:hypothetical protein
MSEEKREYMLQNEDAILRDVSGVLEAMNITEEYETFTVKRKGKKLFAFRVRGLTGEEREKCRNDATKMVKNKKLGGIAVPGDFDSAKFGSLLIVTATHPEDKRLLWDNKELMQKANVLAPWQLVDKVLLSGEKDRVIDLIEHLSGFDEDDNDLEETLKNS